jgi:hypothetical protein
MSCMRSDNLSVVWIGRRSGLAERLAEPSNFELVQAIVPEPYRENAADEREIPHMLTEGRERNRRCFLLSMGLFIGLVDHYRSDFHRGWRGIEQGSLRHNCSLG